MDQSLSGTRKAKGRELVWEFLVHRLLSFGRVYASTPWPDRYGKPMKQARAVTILRGIRTHTAPKTVPD